MSLETSLFLIFAVTVFTFIDQDDQVMRDSEVTSNCFMATELALVGGTCKLRFLLDLCCGVLLN